MATATDSAPVKRLARWNYTLEDAMAEIAMAEAILDGMGAATGMTLWGRIASIKDKSPNIQVARAAAEKLPVLNLEWPEEMQDAWWRWFEPLMNDGNMPR